MKKIWRIASISYGIFFNIVCICFLPFWFSMALQIYSEGPIQPAHFFFALMSICLLSINIVAVLTVYANIKQTDGGVDMLMRNVSFSSKAVACYRISAVTFALSFTSAFIVFFATM